MKNWLRKLLGIDSIDQTISDNNTLLQSTIEDISKKMSGNSDTQSQLEKITDILVNAKKEDEVTILEPATKIQLGSDSGMVDFNLDNNFRLDENWTRLNSSNSRNNIFSQASGASAIAATSMYSASGLYTATASASELMVYGNGTISSITMNGSKFGIHAGFVGANAAVFAPILIFQIASMVTGQYYFNGLSKQLTSLHESINSLIAMRHNERLAKLRYINSKITDLNKKSFFTTEDYIHIDQLKYDLSVIRFEYLLTASHEIQKSIDNVKPEDTQVIEVISDDTNALEKVKLTVKDKATRLTSFLGEKFNDFYEDSVAQKAVSGVKNFSENSSSKAEKLTKEILESKYFFYSDIALKAEHLYQLSKLLELKMNIADKNPDANRLGKINEIYTSISNFNEDDSIFDEVAALNNQLRSKLVTDLTALTENSLTNKNKIIATSKKITKELDQSDDLIARKHLLFGDIQKIKEGFEKPHQIVIDNREGKAELYSKIPIQTVSKPN
ncbi:hypothetical protein [Nonlabens sp. Asnod3-H03]|uniref:hypothetical protein n=1 Tax=Nonlabens sp. Asnod3-H03 TaxID=3160580 RepID=UPI00386D77D8